MRRIGLMLLSVAGFAVAAGESEVIHWTLAEVKAAEATLAQDPKAAARNPMLTNKALDTGDSVRRTSYWKTGEVEIHANVTDVFSILTGEGEFVIGGEMVNPRTTNPGEIRAPSVTGGVTKKFVAGDMFIVPPGTPHQVVIPQGGHSTFMVAKLRK